MTYDCLFFNQHFMYIWAIWFPNLYSFLSFKLIRVSISDFGRPFKLLIQSFNPHCSADYLQRGIATLSVLLQVYVVTCLDVYLAIDWLILECTDGNQRNEISSLFNALLLWDISICSAILKACIPPEMRRMQRKSGAKKHGGKKEEKKKGQVWLGLRLGRWNNVNRQSVGSRQRWDLGGHMHKKKWHSYLTGVYGVWHPLIHLLRCVKEKKKGGMFPNTTKFLSNHALQCASNCMPRQGCTKCDVLTLIENCLRCGTHLLHDILYCLRKVAPSFRGCIIVRSQYFYGWKKKVSSTERCTVGQKKEAFCTPLLMFEIR